MNDMLKSWTFWKPIVTWLAYGTAYILFLFYTPPKAGLVIFITLMGCLAIWLLYTLGKWNYESNKRKDHE